MKNYCLKGKRMKIVTYNVRTVLKDEHVQELEEELKENNMKCDVIGLGEVRRKEERFTITQVACSSATVPSVVMISFPCSISHQSSVTVPSGVMISCPCSISHQSSVTVPSGVMISCPCSISHHRTNLLPRSHQE